MWTDVLCCFAFIIGGAFVGAGIVFVAMKESTRLANEDAKYCLERALAAERAMKNMDASKTALRQVYDRQLEASEKR